MTDDQRLPQLFLCTARAHLFDCIWNISPNFTHIVCWNMVDAKHTRFSQTAVNFCAMFLCHNSCIIHISCRRLKHLMSYWHYISGVSSLTIVISYSLGVKADFLECLRDDYRKSVQIRPQQENLKDSSVYAS